MIIDSKKDDEAIGSNDFCELVNNALFTNSPNSQFTNFKLLFFYKKILQ